MIINPLHNIVCFVLLFRFVMLLFFKVNMGYILNAAGADYRNVVKTTVLLADISDFQAVNQVMYCDFVIPFCTLKIKSYE